MTVTELFDSHINEIIKSNPRLKNDLLFFVTTTELSAEKLHKITSIKNNIDFVQETSEKYFNDNVIHYLSEKERVEYLGMETAPVLDQKRLDILSANPLDEIWYKNFIKSWLPLVLAKGRNVQDNGTFPANVKVLEADVAYECTKPAYIRQTQALYAHSYVEKVQGFSEYYKDKSKWATEYKNYLTTDEFLEAWIAISTHTPAEMSDLQLRQIVSKLDILDPTMAASREVITKLNMSVILANVYDNIEDIHKHDIFHHSLTQVINDILNSVGDSDEKEVAKILSESFQTGAEFVNALLAGFMATGKNTFAFPALQATTLWEKVKESFSADVLKQIFTRRNGEASVKKLIASIFYAAAIAAFVIGVISFNDQDAFGKTAFVISSFSLVSSIVAHYASDSLSPIIGRGVQYLFDTFATSWKKETIDGFRGVLKVLFTKEVSTFVERRVIPFFIFVTAGFLIKDIVHDVSESNHGAIVMDALALTTTITEGIVMMTSYSWAGPFGGFLALVSVTFMIIKFKVFPDKTPIQKFYSTIPAKYRNDKIKLIEPSVFPTYADIQNKDGKQAGKYFVPKDKVLTYADEPSTRNPFKLTRIGKSQVIISNPFNNEPRNFTKPVYLTEVNSKLEFVEKTEIDESNIFYIAESPIGSPNFSLYSFTGLHLAATFTELALIPDDNIAHSSFQFKPRNNYFSVTENTWSLPYNTKLEILKPESVRYDKHSGGGFGITSTGLYTFNQLNVGNNNLNDYLNSHNTSQLITFSKPAQYLLIDDVGGIKVFDDKNVEVPYTFSSDVNRTTVPQASLIAPFAMIVSPDPNSKYFAIVDSNNLEVELRK